MLIALDLCIKWRDEGVGSACRGNFIGGYDVMVACQLPKLNARVRFPLPAPLAPSANLVPLPGRLNMQLGVRLLLLTGVRTGELRLATPEQFGLEHGLWSIPVVHLKQRKSLTKKKRCRMSDVPPYIVPLSVQAQEIVQHLLETSNWRRSTCFPEIDTCAKAHQREYPLWRTQAHGV